MSFDTAREDVRRLLIRMQAMRRALEREAFGDEAYIQEKIDTAIQDVRARLDPPPDPAVRKRLRPHWSWWKRVGR